MSQKFIFLGFCLILTCKALEYSKFSTIKGHDVKNFYKKFIADPNYTKIGRRSSNETFLSESPDISTTPFEGNFNEVNSYGPIELQKTDPVDVYSLKKSQFKNNFQEMTENPPYTYYSYEEDMSPDYEIIQEPIYMSQMPKPPKIHPRPYDWENYRRRPKLKEVPPSYVIVGSRVPEPPSMGQVMQMPPPPMREPVKTEEDKIADYEKDYKVLPSGINSYLKNKLKFEVDWVTIAKILLKLIIFKKIIKFIIILGLLLFVPKYYKWSNTYLNDSVKPSEETYYYDKYDKWHHHKFHRIPRRKRKTTTTSTTTETPTTTTKKDCSTTTTTTSTTTSTTTTTTTEAPTTSTTTVSTTTQKQKHPHHHYHQHHWCKTKWCRHKHQNYTTTTTTTTPEPEISEDYSFDDDIYIGDDTDELRNNQIDEDLEDFGNENDEILVEDEQMEPENEEIYDELFERNEYTTEYDGPNFYDTFRSVADAHSLDPQRLADISLFLTQAFEAWTSKSLICYGEEDLHCRFFYLYDIMDRNYSTRSIYNFFKDYWYDWWTRRKME